MSWQNPLPQGKTLTSVDFANNDNWLICGYGGIILKTSNCGTNWNVIDNSNTKADLWSIAFSDEKTVFSVGEAGTIIKSEDGGENWTPIYSNTTIPFLYSVDFINKDFGIAVGSNGTILKTTDGGKNWLKKNSGTTKNLSSVCFLDNYRIYAVGGLNSILQSNDGGETWFLKNLFDLSSKYTLRNIQFINPQVGFMSTTDQCFYTTTDGGLNWIKKTTPANFTSVFFIDNNTGYGISFGQCYMTINGGTNWSYVGENKGYILKLINKDLGFSVGSNGEIFKITANGQNWENAQTVQFDYTFALYSVWFADSLTGYAVGDGGRIIKTTNAGKDWINLQVNYSTGNCKSVFFKDAYNGFVVGTGGFIIKTTDGGLNWTYTKINVGETYNCYDIMFPSSNTGYVIAGKYLLKTNNFGATWTISITGGKLLQAGYFVDNNIGYAVGFGGEIFKTINGGVSWSAQISNVTSNLTDVWFTDANTGFISGAFDGLLKTTNGGVTWNKIECATNDMLNSLYFLNKDTGYVVGGTTKGSIQKTIDGGNTWSEIICPGYPFGLYSVFFTKEKVGYVVGYNGLILSTLSTQQKDASGLKFLNTKNKNTNYHLDPITETLHFTGNTNSGKMSIYIYDVSGKLIKSQSLNYINTADVSLKGIKPGIYFFKTSLNHTGEFIKR